MSTPKAIFIDIDGTLLSHSTKQVPKSAKDALQYAHNKGVLLFIATGRSKMELGLTEELGGIPFDGFVTMNGAYCYTDNEVVFKNPLRPETVAAVVERIAHNPFPCMFCEEDRQYINMLNAHVKKLQNIISLPLPPLDNPRQALNREIYQIVAFDVDEEAFLRNLPHTKLTIWMNGGFDVVNATVNKWEGISQMLHHFGLAPHEVAAIGDGENDIEMLANVGFSIAMGNGEDVLKESAKFVTSHIDDDGFKKGIEHLFR